MLLQIKYAASTKISLPTRDVCLPLPRVVKSWMTLTKSWCHSFILQSCSRTSNWWLDWMAWRRKSAAKREGQDKIQNRAEQIGHSRQPAD
ncbi:hypothetical protein T02_5735 [Trichinella nativa]|uniref:Uncharacterized protein n=1 Tax=Trichinella nativa TaxID=6335 RepID=A0A0V1LND2_9BILA|nr:hypothetical protein T02_5735 [Trichinella nativa]